MEELNKVQAPPEVISRLKSISEVQTKGLKRFLIDEKETSNIDQETFKKVKVNSIKGKNRTFLNKTGSIDIPREYNPNIVGFEVSFISSSLLLLFVWFYYVCFVNGCDKQFPLLQHFF